MQITRRDALIGTAATAAAAAAPARAQGFNPPGSLIDAAKKEGRALMYTASFTEVEQATAAEFNKQFPFVKIDIIRSSGGQLITRVRTEAAAGKLVADIVDHSDRVLMNDISDIFADYAPPNADDYLPSSRISDKIWPRITPVWVIAYNVPLTDTPPKTWMDLTNAQTYAPGTIGQVIAPSGGTTWTRILFEYTVLGHDYWKKQAATKPTLFPSSGPTTDAVIRGEVHVAPLIRNVVFPKQQEGAPLETVFPTEGVPINPYASGIPKTAQNKNAAKLFLDWNLSAEGQAWTMKNQGNLTSLKKPPTTLAGFDPDKSKIWLPKVEDLTNLRDKLIPEWNDTYGFRQ